MKIDGRPTLSRAQAREVYDGFARKGHIGGKDTSTGYGGPAVQALLTMALFGDAKTVFEFGCGQAKLANLVLADTAPHLSWTAVDQSPEMISRARQSMEPYGDRFSCALLDTGEPAAAAKASGTVSKVDRYISTFVLDLLSERDMYAVLDDAQARLEPKTGLLLLAGITWGWRDSLRTFAMTLVWEVLYRFVPRVVGGCRPQQLAPYLRARGWTVVSEQRTLPNGFPWMVSEVIAARPPGPAP